MKKQDITELARELRKRQTPQEEKLWQYLRNRKLNGLKFYRQRPIIYGYAGRYLFFIADFYCPEKKLVIELDGAIHRYQKEYDEQRDIIIRQMGIFVLRIKNDELNDIVRVLEKIRTSPPVSPSPCEGEGELKGGEV
jgi:very-short-patch-repair endonuclease